MSRSEKMARKNLELLFAATMNRREFFRAVGGSTLLLSRSALPAAVERTKADPAAHLHNPLAKLRGSHPRLLATSEDFTQLKLKIANDGKLQTWLSKLRREADEIIGAAPSRYEIPDGLRLLATSRRVLDRVYTLGLLYRLEGNSKYAERAWQELDAAAKFPDWNPRHFLDTAEMTHAFAIGYDWLFEVWTADQRNALHQAVVEKGFKPALAVYRSRTGWPKARHNWNQVCNGGMGMGALALGDVEPNLSGEILGSALESLPLAMAEFGPDGGWKEGPGYWNYASLYNVVFLAALQTALGSDFSLSQAPGLSDTGFFPLYLTGPLGRTFNYADGGDRAIHAPQMFWLGRQFNRPVFAWYERQFAAPNALDVLWFDEKGSPPKTTELALDKHFTGAEVVTLRSAWDSSEALFVGFKGGDNQANHSHLDLGDFVFDALGVRWAADLGADDYNLPGYFGSQRWQYYRLRAEGQNTLVINPNVGPDQEPNARARIIRFESKPQRAIAIADLTEAYRKQARKVLRGIALLDRNKLLVQDEVQADTPAELYWFMHTPAAVRIEPDARTVTLRQVGAELRLEILSPANGKFEIMDPAPLPISPQPPIQARNEGFKKVAIHLRDVTDTRITILFQPVLKGEGKLAKPITLRYLTEW